MKYIIKTLIILSILFSSWAGASQTKMVTILSWWGYLNKPWVKEQILEKCKTKIAIQTYKDANDFSRSFDIKNYDIAIFESTQVQHFMHTHIENNSKLHLNAQNYHPLIKEVFKDNIKPQNMAFFLISNTVFLYNPKNITLHSKDTISSIIRLLNKQKPKKAFVLIDDAVIVNQLIKSEMSQTLNTQKFKELFDYNHLILSNDFNDYQNLGVFITWSGIANYHKKKAAEIGVELKIITIPSYSYITSDIIAQLNSSKEASCVASLIASKDFMEKLQYETYYYSPYMTFSNIQDPTYKKMYRQFFDMMQNKELKWLLPTKDELNKIQSSWEQIIFDYGL